MIIHFSVLAVILVCALIWERPIRYHKLNSIYYGERYDYKSPLMPWLIVFGYIAYLAAMRSGMNDTSGYIQSFEHIPGTWDDVSRILDGDGKDKAFDITANIFKMYVSDDYHGWFGLFAAVESCIFIHVLRRESVSFLDSCFVLFATALYYNYFSMMRQWFAVVLLFGGAIFIKEGKTIPYILLCLFAAQFHNSAYLFIPVYFMVTGRAWSPKQNLIIIAAVVGLFFLEPILDAVESSLANSTYDYAVAAMNSDSGSSIIRPVIAAVPVRDPSGNVYRRLQSDPLSLPSECDGQQSKQERPESGILHSVFYFLLLSDVPSGFVGVQQRHPGSILLRGEVMHDDRASQGFEPVYHHGPRRRGDHGDELLSEY